MNKTVLIVDDDEDIRETMREALEFEGYTTFTAINGAAALEVLKKNEITPALIILDLMMPVMDGSKFLEVIHNDYKDSYAKIPVILATAKGNPVALPNSDLAHEKIRKPIELDELYAVVKKYCGEPLP